MDPGTAVNTSPEQNRVRADRIEAIAATVPAAVRESGKLTVATTGSGSPPLSFRADDDRTVIGVEPDLAQLVADTLGLRLDLQPTSWENLFLGVESGTYDAGFSNITVTEERKDKYDFATYRVDTVTFEARNAGGWSGSRSPPTSPGSPSASHPAPTRSRSWSSGTGRTRPRGRTGDDPVLPEHR